MQDGVSSFPLLQLPNNPLKCILQNMFVHQQVGFSILSKRSKALIKSLNLTAFSIVMTLDDTISMEILRSVGLTDTKLFFSAEQFWYNVAEGIELSPTKIYTPEFLYTERFEENGTCEFAKAEFEMKDWVDHFLFIFNHSAVKLNFSDGTPFDLDCVQRAINDVTEIYMSDRYSLEYTQQVVETYPSVKQFSLAFNTQANLNDHHAILCQNFDCLTLWPIDMMDELIESAKCKLNDLLIMNSRSVMILIDFNEKDFNRFLKHWIEGSNPRMEHFEISSSEGRIPNKEIVLNGIDYQIISTDYESLFEKPMKNGDDGSRFVIVKGGYDIQRMDGTIATIVMNEDPLEEYFNIEFFVWH